MRARWYDAVDFIAWVCLWIVAFENNRPLLGITIILYTLSRLGRLF